mmetsp:Transcript_11537/g.28112  ORF Transcript_11537/g.28112 Transcript_11537/m.28112 type:complete len:299 (+) Transcript_11537:739-1635(+)
MKVAPPVLRERWLTEARSAKLCVAPPAKWKPWTDTWAATSFLAKLDHSAMGVSSSFSRFELSEAEEEAAAARDRSLSLSTPRVGSSAERRTTRPPVGASISCAAESAAPRQLSTPGASARRWGSCASRSCRALLTSPTGMIRRAQGRGTHGSSASGQTRSLAFSSEPPPAASTSGGGRAWKCSASSKVTTPTSVWSGSSVSRDPRMAHALARSPERTLKLVASMRKSKGGHRGGRAMYSLGTRNSQTPRSSSGRSLMSRRTPSGPRLQKYSRGTSVADPHRLHTNVRPPSMKVTKGFM